MKVEHEIIGGTLTRDAELRLLGSTGLPVVTLNLKCGNKEFATVKTKFELANACASLRRGDSVICSGKWQSRTYKDKTYFDFEASAVVLGISPISHAIPAVPINKQTESKQMQGSLFNEFSDPLADGDIPF